MKIDRLTFHELNIPFKQSFTHASATRSQTESVLAIAKSKSGHTGYGEGCPRSYVTGETIETSFQLFNDYQQELIKIQDLRHLISWVSDSHEVIDRNPAAWCAIELALLDMLGKETGQPVESLLSLPELSESFPYTAVLGVNSLSAFDKQFQQYLGIGFRDFKVKISGNLKEDREKIDLIKKHNIDQIRIRLDANNFWKTPDEAIDYIEKLKYPFFAIEEPLQTGQYESCQKIHTALKIPIVLDESFTRQDQFQQLKSSSGAWIINLRISKMGGILRSLDVAQQAETLRIPIIVGAQVGETSLLTRAALTVANTYSKNTVAQEGAFGTHLLERDITSEPVMFEKEGRLLSSNFSQKPGLGIEINEIDL